MDTRAAQLDLLVDLEHRHNELMRRLDELDKRIERAIADCQRDRAVLVAANRT